MSVEESELVERSLLEFYGSLENSSSKKSWVMFRRAITTLEESVGHIKTSFEQF